MIRFDDGTVLAIRAITSISQIKIDEQMTRILVQENGDIWLKRGFSGSIKAYGVKRIALRKKDSLLKGRITIYYTKGFINFDPADLKGFVACAKERNPHADYREE
jgi:hypothetical protein